MTSDSVVRWLSAICREVVIIAFAAGALLVLGQVIRQTTKPYVARDVGTEMDTHKPNAGIDMKIQIRDVTEYHHLTAVLFLSPSCQYCVRSAAFYKELAMESKLHSIPLIVALPDARAAGPFLKLAGLVEAIHRSWDDVNVKVAGTPTVLLVDAFGNIRRIWVGELSTKRQEDIKGFFRNKTLLAGQRTSTDSGDPNLGSSDILELQRRDAAVLLDVRERSDFAIEHHRDAVNIPLEELPTRIPFELDAEVRTIVDCSRLTRASLCQNALDRLAEHDFRDIAALNASLIKSDLCKLSPRISSLR